MGINITSITNQIINSQLYCEVSNAFFSLFTELQTIEFRAHARTATEKTSYAAQVLYQEAICPNASLLTASLTGVTFVWLATAVLDPLSKENRLANIALNVLSGAVSYSQRSEHSFTIFLSLALATSLWSYRKKAIALKHAQNLAVTKENVITNKNGSDFENRINESNTKETSPKIVHESI